MNKKDLIAFIRSSLNISMPSEDGLGVDVDPAFLSMKDEDIELYLKVAIARVSPDITVDSITPEKIYPISLLTKIELYTKLAVLRADKVDMGADNNNFLKLDQRFKHYMALVKSAKDEYDSYINSDGLGEVYSANVLIENRYMSKRTYEFQPEPKIHISVGRLASDFVEISFTPTNVSKFARYEVYVNENESAIDLFREGYNFVNKIREGSQKVLSTSDIHDTKHRLQNLKQKTTYYIAVFVLERNGLYGVSEVKVETLEEITSEDSAGDSSP